MAQTYNTKEAPTDNGQDIYNNTSITSTSYLNFTAD